MIHLLQIGADTTPTSLTKQARRLAMTGGFEFDIVKDLSVAQLNILVNQFEPELKQFQPLTSSWQASNAYRLLFLVYQHANADIGLRERLSDLLNIDGETNGNSWSKGTTR